jgi:hypothetical protein
MSHEGPKGLPFELIAAALPRSVSRTLSLDAGAARQGSRSAGAHAPMRASLEGPTLSAPHGEPRLQLCDSLGGRGNIAGYRGRAVLVTFIFTRYPGACPLIVANPHDALALLGPRVLEWVSRPSGITASPPAAEDGLGQSAVIYGIAGSGEVTKMYPSHFKPSTIAHDVPRLAAL